MYMKSVHTKESNYIYKAFSFFWCLRFNGRWENSFVKDLKVE